MSVEYTCCECQRHIVNVTHDEAPYGKLCLLCIHMPSWFEDEKLVKIFDPDRDKDYGLRR